MTSPLRTATLVLALAVATVGCASSAGHDSKGPARTQAVERLHNFGLTKDQASCVVDRLGADTVVEAGDLTALSQGGPYQDAAKACTKGS